MLDVYDVVILTSGLWFMVQLLRFVFPPLFGTFQSIYGISNTETGLLFTLMMAGYSIIQFPAGILADRLGKASTVTLGAVGFTVSSLLVALSPNYTVIVLAAIAIGITTGFHKTVAIPFLSNLYEENTGGALGVMDTVGQFGGIVAPLFVVTLLSTALGWRSVFLISAIVSFTLTALFAVRVLGDEREQTTEKTATETTNDTTSQSKGLTESIRQYATILLDWEILFFIVVTMLFAFAWSGVSAFLPLFLTDAKGVSTDTASVIYSVLFAASVMQIATGSLSDRYDPPRILLGLFFVMISGLSVLLVSESVIVFGVTTFVMGSGFHGFRPVRDSYLMDLIPESVSGGGLGIVRTGMTAAGALSPAIVGYISDIANFIVAFAFLVGALIVATVVMFVHRILR